MIKIMEAIYDTKMAELMLQIPRPEKWIEEDEIEVYE